MPVIEIICLANSRKYQHHCIAGVRTDGDGWLRPVGTAAEGSLSTPEITLPDGTPPRLLDVIRIGCSAPQPKPHQPENWTIDREKWELVARPAANAARILNPYISPRTPLLGDRQDRIPRQFFQFSPAKASLSLVRPENVIWEVRLTPDFHRQTRVRFRLGSVFYNLSVTDPLAAARLGTHPPGLYTPEDAGYAAGADVLFTASLGEPTSWDQCCYKLIAGVIVLPPE